MEKISSSDHTLLLGESGIGKAGSYILSLSMLCKNYSRNYKIFEDEGISRLLYANKYPIPVPNTQHGGLIILPSIEKLFKVYKTFRQVSPSLKIVRAHSKLFENSANVSSADSQIDCNTSNIDVFKNKARNAEWPLVDIILTTPGTLFELVDLQIKLEIPEVNPSFIVFDQAFTIFSKKKDYWDVAKSLEHFKNLKDTKIILTSDFAPNSSYLKDIKKKYKDLEIVSSGNIEKIPNNVKVSAINIPHQAQFDTLVKVVKENAGKKIAVYSKLIHKSKSLQESLLKAEINSVIIHSRISTMDRLNQYLEGKTDGSVLICDEIIAINFDFKADIVIFLDLPDVFESFAHIIGNFCRNDQNLQVILLLESDQKKFVELMQPGRKWESLEPMFRSKLNIYSLDI